MSLPAENPQSGLWPPLAVHEDAGHLHGNCPGCGRTGSVTEHPGGLVLFECPAKCGAGSGVYRRVADTSGVAHSPLTAGRSPVDVPVPVPSIGEKEREDLFVALDAHEAGELEPQRVETRESRPWWTPSMQRVLDDLAFCSGLLLARGDDGTVIYAVDEMAKRLGMSSSTMSTALKRLRSCGAIRIVKVLPQPEPRRPARVYAIVPGRPKLRAIDGGRA